MNLGNTLFTRQDDAGHLQGVSVDLMHELANRLGVPLELVVYDEPGQVADASSSGTWDVAILAIEKSRAQTLSFSPAMTEIEAGYIVPHNSALHHADQVDAKGVTIAAPVKAGYELYLSGSLKNASIVRTQNFAHSLEVFSEHAVCVLAGLKPNLMESLNKLPDSRLLSGNFMTVNHGFAIPRGRAAADEFLQNFVKDLLASGFVARSIDKHQIQGLTALSL